MPSPFPGMDPYLESPNIWHGLHLGLIYQVQVTLAPQVAPQYYVAVEERTYIAPVEPNSLVGLPDVAVIREAQETGVSYATLAPVVEMSPVAVRIPMTEEVRERRLEIRTVGDDEIITVIEVLSPTNKRNGAGRIAYEDKRAQVLRSWASLVEIDLLRGGEPMPILGKVAPSHYRLLVSRPWERPRAQLYPFNLNQPIPEIPIPLSKGDAEAKLDLGSLLSQVYDQARYDLRVKYTHPPEPPLEHDWAAWANSVLEKSAKPPSQ